MKRKHTIPKAAVEAAPPTLSSTRVHAMDALLQVESVCRSIQIARLHLAFALPPGHPAVRQLDALLGHAQRAQRVVEIVARRVP